MKRVIGFCLLFLCLGLTTYAQGQFSGGASGGSSSVTAASPVTATIYLSPNCNGVTATCISTPANTQILSTGDCAWTTSNGIVTCGVLSGTATITQGQTTLAWASGNHFTNSMQAQSIIIGGVTYTVTSFSSLNQVTISPAFIATTGTYAYSTAIPHFTVADVGKQAWGYGSCDPFTSQPAGGAITTTHTTILSYQSPTQITLSATPANAAAAGITSCFIYGTPDDAAAVTVDALLQTATACPKLEMAAAYYLYTTPHHFAQPLACNNLGGLTPGGTVLGNLGYYMGFVLEGRDVGPTTWFIPPDFPQTGSCVNGSGASGGNACFAVPLEGAFKNINITSGASNGGIPTGKALMFANVGQLENFGCTGAGAGTALTYGIQIAGWTQLRQVVNSSCGSVGLRVTGTTSPVWTNGLNVHVENSYTNNLLIDSGSNFTCNNCVFDGTQTNTGSFVAIQNNGGVLTFHDVAAQQSTPPITSNFTVYQAAINSILVTGGFVLFDPGAVSGGVSIKCTGICTNYLQRTQLNAGNAGSSFIYQDVSGSILKDLCGNYFNGPISLAANGVYGSCSVTGVPVVAANLVPNANWGTGAAVSGVTATDVHRFSFTLTNGSASVGANPTIVFTYPLQNTTGFISIPVCSMWQVGGTQAITAATQFLTPSSASATSVTFTYNATPTINLTEVYQGSCDN